MTLQSLQIFLTEALTFTLASNGGAAQAARPASNRARTRFNTSLVLPVP